MAEIKRPLYFTSQFLVEGDFQAEQAYHVGMRRLLNVSLHTWGVVKGLDVTKGASKQVSVSAGIAVDRDGREIVIPADRAPQAVDLSAVAPGASVFITIGYSEQTLEEDRYTGAGLKDKFTRVTERPELKAIASVPDDGTVIKLARVTVSAGGDLTIDSSARRLSSSLIAKGTDVDLGNVTITGSLKVTGSVGIGTLNPDRALTIQGAAGTFLNVKGNNGAVEALLGADAAGGIVSTMTNHDLQLRAGGNDTKLVVKANGNIGIGTGATAPAAKLQVTGGAIMPAAGNSAQAGIQFPAAGAGDEAFVRYFATAGETTKLMIGVGNDADDAIGFFQAGAERMTVHGGNIGIGLAANPGFKLDVGDRMRVRQGASASSGIWFFQNTPAADRAFVGMAADNQVGFWGNTGASWGLVMDTTNGNIGMGTTAPDRALTIQGAAGTYMNCKGNNGTFEVLLGSDTNGGIVSTMTNHDLQLRAGGNNTKMIIKANGSVGIGTLNPGSMLEVNGPIRAANSDIYFTETAHNHTGVGNAAGFAAIENGASHNCLMIIGRTTSVSPLFRRVELWDFLRVNGDLVVTGRLTAPTKTGCVVDMFVNKFDETLEQGDVVVIGENQSSLYYGPNKNIPIPEVDIVQVAYDTRVCGIVSEIHGELSPESEQESKAPAKGKKTTSASSKKGSSAAKLHPREFTVQEMSTVDITKVEPDQIGLMVTLGAYAHCKVDADIAPINAGDLLTTSPTKGHAQKVLDHTKAVGAIIGKALGSLKKGKGKIPVLVAMQ